MYKHKIIKTALLCYFVLSFGILAHAQVPEAAQKALQQKTEARILETLAKSKGIVGMAAVDLKTGDRIGVNDTYTFAQASAIKIPILVEVYKQAAEGKFKLNDWLFVRKAARTGGSGLLQHFADSAAVSVRDLCLLMIIQSDNTATNMLIDLVGLEKVSQTMTALGLPNIKLQRKMITPEASAKGIENIASPTEAARLMQMIYKGEVVSAKVCAEMLEILKKNENSNIKQALPAATVAFKTGSLGGVTTEWAIVYLPERPFVLVLMENFEVGDESSAIFQEVTKLCAEYFSRLGKSTRYGVYVAPELLNK